VTAVLSGKLAAHVVGQLIPAGALTTLPLPVPVKATLTPSPAMKDAVTVVAAVIVTVQLEPEHPPLQPLKK
jgi:hypothetical protein